jgi:hypothetical protein
MDPGASHFSCRPSVKDQRYLSHCFRFRCLSKIQTGLRGVGLSFLISNVVNAGLNITHHADVRCARSMRACSFSSGASSDEKWNLFAINVAITTPSR